MKQRILVILLFFISLMTTLTIDNVEMFKNYETGVVLDKWLSTEQIGKKTYTYSNLKVQFEEYAEDLRVDTSLYKKAQIKGKVKIEKRYWLVSLIMAIGYFTSIISGLAVLAIITNKFKDEGPNSKLI